MRLRANSFDPSDDGSDLTTDRCNVCGSKQAFVKCQGCGGVLCERHEELAIDATEGDYCPVCSDFVCGDCCMALNEQAGREPKGELNTESSVASSAGDDGDDRHELLCGGCGAAGWPAQCVAARARLSAIPGSPSRDSGTPPRNGTRAAARRARARRRMLTRLLTRH